MTARKSLVGFVVDVVPGNKSRRGLEILISICWLEPRIPILLEFGGGISVSVVLLDDELELLAEPLAPPLLLFELPPEELPPDELPPPLLRELLPPLPPPLRFPLPPPVPEPPPAPPPDPVPPELVPPEPEPLELEDVVEDDADSSAGGGVVNVMARMSSSIRRIKARANWARSISSRPLDVIFQD